MCFLYGKLSIDITSFIYIKIKSFSIFKKTKIDQLTIDFYKEIVDLGFNPVDSNNLLHRELVEFSYKLGEKYSNILKEIDSIDSILINIDFLRGYGSYSLDIVLIELFKNIECSNNPMGKIQFVSDSEDAFFTNELKDYCRLLLAQSLKENPLKLI